MGGRYEKEKYGRSCDLFLIEVSFSRGQPRNFRSNVCILWQKGIECKVINGGREGLETIRKEKFDLVLLDLAMPEFSGKDVIRSLTKDQLVQKNIVIFTASSDPVVLEQMKGSGIKEIFKKPFSLEQLTELIEKYRPQV